MLGAVVEGVPAGLALTEDDLAVDLARRQRGYGRGARQTIEHDRARILGGRPPRPDPRVADPARGRQPRLGELDPRDAGRAADRRRGGGARDARRGRQQARPADHPGPAGARGPRRGAEVRVQRRARRAGTLVGARDHGSCRGGRRGAGVPAGARDRGLVVHRRGRRRRDRPGARDTVRATRPTPLPCAARTPTPRTRWSRGSTRRARTATRWAACSRSWSTGRRSGSAATSTGTGGWTRPWPRP